jgi:hypothetical protein
LRGASVEHLDRADLPVLPAACSGSLRKNIASAGTIPEMNPFMGRMTSSHSGVMPWLSKGYNSNIDVFGAWTSLYLSLYIDVKWSDGVTKTPHPES